MNNKFAVAIAIISFGLLGLGQHVARAADEGEGKTITVSAEGKPAFKITLPAGWKAASEPVTLDTLASDSDSSVTMQFGKLGEVDAATAKKKAADEAQMFVAMGGNDKNAAAPAATDKEIAGHKGYAFSTSYTSSGKTKQLSMCAFSVDGKTYNYFVVQGPKEKVDEADEMAESIAAP